MIRAFLPISPSPYLYMDETIEKLRILVKLLWAFLVRFEEIYNVVKNSPSVGVTTRC
jgi:hypothetical protein